MGYPANFHVYSLDKEINNAMNRYFKSLSK